MIQLDILSDPICPWCHIGKAWLDEALDIRPDHPFVIRWHPFQLNPDMPSEGMDRRIYLETKFGGRDAAARVYRRIAEAASETGLSIDFDAIPRVPNTIDAHRLILWAGIEGRQGAVVDTLFRAFFLGHRDIGDRAVLLDIAEACGLDRAMTAHLFDSGADVEEVRIQDRGFREMGVTGVPTFIVNRTHVLQGAQPTELWLRVIADIAGPRAVPPAV